MNEETTARLALPLIAPGQAQKELTHNEALALIDLAVGGGVATVGADVPPAAPEIGQAWIVGTAPVAAWAGRAGAIAGWTAGGWRFVAPRPGMTIWSIADAVPVRFLDGGWIIGDTAARRVVIGGVQVVGARTAAISVPNGGTTIDVEARQTIANVLMSLRQHGLIAS